MKRLGLVMLMVGGLVWGKEMKCRTVIYPMVGKVKPIGKWRKGMDSCKATIQATQIVKHLEEKDGYFPYAVEVRNASDEELQELGSWIKLQKAIRDNAYTYNEKFE